MVIGDGGIGILGTLVIGDDGIVNLADVRVGIVAPDDFYDSISSFSFIISLLPDVDIIEFSFFIFFWSFVAVFKFNGRVILC